MLVVLQPFEDLGPGVLMVGANLFRIMRLLGKGSQYFEERWEAVGRIVNTDSWSLA